MRAIHVHSFSPFFARHGTKAKPKADRFDLYCTVISALNWRKYNGEIHLVCDKAAAEYYDETGISDIWDKIRIIIPDDLEGINPIIFWAAAKLLALREVCAPAVILDTDFIVWKMLKFGDSIIAAHREDLNPDVYPGVNYFQMEPLYKFMPFDYTVQPLNTAFLYLPDESFKQFYVSMAIDFMKSAMNVSDNLCYMVYAEQRLLAMCAERLKMPVETLLDKDKLFESQNDFTHLWGEKQKMRNNPEAEQSFNNRCAARIRRDFPEYEHMINLIEKA
ncbi:MAG: hypothetical protein LBC82_04945 [Oscillospiraceae bacterium]|jgi:hypothetical protein|nr:hypothetical protein [Oscillospiraceae bacterium]